MTRVDATAYLQPYPARWVRRPVVLRETPGVYPLEPSPEQAWLPIAFRAMARVGARAPVRDVLIVGTGNGLDALGAAEILAPRSITITDLHPAGVAVARRNARAHLLRGAPALTAYAGDLLDAVPAGLRVDLVYENLPNVTADAGADLTLGDVSGRFHAAVADEALPQAVADHALALHHRCLRQARDHLRPGGGVLTAIGGRIPRAVALDLHRSLGYEPELAAFDVKRQVEPAVMLAGYRRAEADGPVRFTFYAIEAVTLVAGARRDGLEGDELADALEADLAGLAMTTAEAQAVVARGGDVAHSVLMIWGRRPGERDAGTPETP